MNDDTSLELRVLSGMHAGARVLLEGDEYFLGTRDDCDFVLTDPGILPRHARLVLVDGVWLLEWLPAEEGDAVLAPAPLDRSKAVPFGPIVVMADEPGTPWPTLEELVLVPHAPATESLLPPPVQAVAPVIAPTRKHSLRRIATPVAIAAVSLSTLGLVAWPMGLSTAPRAFMRTPAASAAATAAATSEPAGKAEIEAIVAELHLADRSKLEQDAGRWSVRTLVLNESEGESLAKALTRVQPHPALRLATVADMRDELTDRLQRLAPEARGKVQVRASGDGRVGLVGSMPRTEDRNALASEMAAAFPQVRAWDNAVAAGDDVGALLVADLQASGFDVAVLSKDGEMKMQVKLRQQDVPRWERALAEAVRQYPVPFNADLVFAAAAPSEAARQATRAPVMETQLPFEVRSVVGGEMPYVLLAGGEKLARGGAYAGWRFAGLNKDSQAVFENGSRRAVLQR
jgi:type III secretion protein D